MKRFCALLALTLTAFAADSQPLLVGAGQVLTQPDLRQPLGPEWTVTKGKWEVKEGVLTASEIAEEHHAAVLHLSTGPKSIVWECEFRFVEGKVFYVGCDASKHVGRLVITPKSVKLAEDSTEVKGVTPSHTLAEVVVDLKPGDWQQLRVEYTGNQLAARLNATELKAEHPYLATPKVRWWFAASGSKLEIRHIRVSEGQPLPPK